MRISSDTPRPTRPSGQAPATYLAAVGDVNDQATWSGIPYHFLLAGCKHGLIDEGLKLSASGPAWGTRRRLWNLGQVLKRRHYGGYQYQSCFLERLYAPIRQKLNDNRVINCFQLYPSSVVKDDRIEKWFYIDMTLRQLFDFYGVAPDKRTADEAVERERQGYHAAEGVMTLSQWAAESVIRHYGVPAQRVQAVIPGANLDPTEYAAWDGIAVCPALRADSPLRLVFVGKYWKRKGLDRLIDSFRLARARGADITLKIIGVSRESAPLPYRVIEGVEWTGFLHKRKDAARFFRAVAECDVGCLLSREDASPIALREYCALGLVTLSTDAGGSPEMTVPAASVSVPVSACETEIADLIVGLSRDRARFHEMRLAAWQARHTALWDATVARILKFWPYAVTFPEPRPAAMIAQHVISGARHQEGDH